MTSTGPDGQAVAVGGPLDGTVLGDDRTERYEVRMADGTVHLYVRSSVPPGGRSVYAYAGRR